jgi:hypothetical protein
MSTSHPLDHRSPPQCNMKDEWCLGIKYDANHITDSTSGRNKAHLPLPSVTEVTAEWIGLECSCVLATLIRTLLICL